MKTIIIIIVAVTISGCMSYHENTHDGNGILSYEFVIDDNYTHRYKRQIKIVERSYFGEKKYYIQSMVKGAIYRPSNTIEINGAIFNAESQREHKGVDLFIGEYLFRVSRETINEWARNEFTIKTGSDTYRIHGESLNKYAAFVNWIEYKYSNHEIKMIDLSGK